MEHTTGKFTSAAHALEFTLAGRATLTLVSVKTGVRYTFRIRKGDDDSSPHFVGVLTGPDNTSSFRYLGVIFDSSKFVVTRKSTFSRTSPPATAFAYFLRNVLTGVIPAQLEVWHEGRCGRCNRKLTVPASIARGLGPTCAGV